MTRAPGRLFRPVLLLAGLAWFAACSDHDATAPDGIELLAAASSGGGFSVTAANPAYGKRGETGLAVTILGSGFKQGAQASWKLDGGSTSDVVVQSTQYVSSTQLIATIDIAGAAALTYYDVSVTQTGRKGIGTESVIAPDLFEVTQAITVAGTDMLRGVNDNGEITGQAGPIYWSEASGLQYIDASTAGFAISPLGNAIVANSYPRLYTRAGPVGTSWQRTMLPVDVGTTGGGAHALLADAVTGQVTLIAGRVEVPTSNRRGGSTYYKPRLWLWQPAAGTWNRIALSTGSQNSANIRQVSGNGLVVGALGTPSGSGRAGSSSQAALWQPDGSGGWSLVALAPVPSAAEGINRAGTLIVGSSGGSAVHWQQLAGGAWSGPISLPSGCTDARAVDDSGRIAADGCTTGTSGVVFVLPYASSTAIHLGGLGKSNGAFVESMSPSGSWIVGQSGGIGVYWRPF